jgi:hypothetical protein
VHFQLNIVDLLERDLIRGRGTTVAGVLLGRIEHGRKQMLIVEDYEQATNVATLDAPDSGSGDRHLLEEVVERWHSRPEKRITILGSYRSCPHEEISVSNDDLELSKAYTESERIFLLIEHQTAKPSRATLYMVRDGAVAWKWHTISFNRKELAEKGTRFQLPLSGRQDPSHGLLKVTVPEKLDSNQLTTKQPWATHSAQLGF